MSALHDAIRRSASEPPPSLLVTSPLSALGRRRVSKVEVLAQSVSTMSPAYAMISVAVVLTGLGSGWSAVASIVAATLVAVVIGSCAGQFARRMTASGSLYAFVAQGLGPRFALVAGGGLLLGYVMIMSGMLVRTADSLTAGYSYSTALPMTSVETSATLVAVAAAICACAVRGVRFATRVILGVELLSIALIIVLLLQGSPDVAPQLPLPGVDGAPPFAVVVLATIAALAGFESAAHLGPEAKNPMRVVPRVLVAAPALVGALLVVSAVAVATGRTGTLLQAYFYGTSSGVGTPLVAALHISLTCSWCACALGCINAASRLLYSMGIEGVAPRATSKVHNRFRTPFVAMIVVTSVAVLSAPLFDTDNPVWERSLPTRLLVDFAFVIAYGLVSVAVIVFLRRIDELQARVAILGAIGAGASGGFVVYLAIGVAAEGDWAALAAGASTLVLTGIWLIVLLGFRPAKLHSIGVFDSVESSQILPGAGVIAVDAAGRPASIDPIPEAGEVDDVGS